MTLEIKVWNVCNICILFEFETFSAAYILNFEFETFSAAYISEGKEGKICQAIQYPFYLFGLLTTLSFSFECYNPMFLKFVGLMPFILLKITEYPKELSLMWVISK